MRTFRNDINDNEDIKNITSAYEKLNRFFQSYINNVSKINCFYE